MLFLFCLIIPLVGTVLGAAAVFCIRVRIGRELAASLDGLAAGVMTASAIFSLLLPALDYGSSPLSALWGLFFGFLFFFAAERLVERFRDGRERASLAAFAITLHNLPEGMAVGIALAAALLGTEGVTLRAALLLSVGIAIQNIPEGAIVSLPAQASGRGRGVAFFKGALSGAVEPIGAIFAFLLSELTVGFLPFLLAFAAAAMLSSVVGELSASFVGRSGAWGRVFFAVGFVLMTSLDVLFS